MASKQRTVKREVRFEGLGVHSGKNGVLILKPAEIDAGIILQNAKDISKKIKIGKVVPIDAQYATILNNGNGWTVSTIEHVMAAIGALGLDNLVIEVEGSEFPIMDGSSLPFVKEILEAGICEQDAPKKYLTPKQPLRFYDEEHNRCIHILPAQSNGEGVDKNLYIDYEASFDSPHLPNSSMRCCLTEEIFLKEIAPARTFGFLEQLPFLRKHGLAKGASLENTVVICKDGYINERRFEDECTRHKLLDLLGDLSLLGKSLIGTVKASRTGHKFNRLVVEHFISNPDQWVVI